MAFHLFVDSDSSLTMESMIDDFITFFIAGSLHHHLVFLSIYLIFAEVGNQPTQTLLARNIFCPNLI